MKCSALLTFLAVFLLAGSTLTFAFYRDQSAQPTDNRFALIIGNNAYSESPLKNPVNDATSMADALKKLGFKVDLVVNADKKTMEKAIDSFIKKLPPGRVALVYYAGHGMQIDGENYLLPTNFSSEDEVEAKYSSYSASRLLERLEYGNNGLNIIILDACRNNPFRSFRTSSRGLAIMKSEQGTFIAFATAPGKVADDNRSSSNGLFTSYLIQTINEPGLTLDQLFGRVREKVALASGRQQIPWVSTSVIGEFYFIPMGKPPSPVLSVNPPQTSITPRGDTSEQFSSEWVGIPLARKGPEASKTIIQTIDTDNTLVKYYAGEISSDEEIANMITSMGLGTVSHTWDQWFYYDLPQNKKLFLAWRAFGKGTYSWILVSRNKDKWYYQVNGAMPHQLEPSKSIGRLWWLGKTSVSIEVRLWQPDSHRKAEIFYRFHASTEVIKK